MNYLVGIIVLVVILYGCTSRWKPQLDTKRDLPWCGKNQKVILETKKTSAPFSATGYQTHWRWLTNKSKQNPTNFGRKIDSFLMESNILQQWPKSGSYVGTEEGTKQLINAPYIFELASVEPLIVFMRPKLDQDGKTYRGDLITSSYLTNYYYYGTKFLYHPEAKWFSPDLKQKPTALNLKVASELNIQLKNSLLNLREEGSWVYIIRK